jgi:hypothetical protein
MPTQSEKIDSRPRFGWADSLDNEPQVIREEKFKGSFPVAVLPLPFMSSKRRSVIRKIQKDIFP